MSRFAFFAGLAAALLLTACSSGTGGTDAGPTEPTTASGGSSGLTFGGLFGSGSDARRVGYAVGDEPHAVKAAADILAQGGSAADAATAAYFTMAVTYPGAAGLGGGGLCLVYDPASRRSEAIDFLARNAAAGGAFAVPGNVRGFATLQGRYGALPWQRDVANAEALAATGFPISDALAARLNAGQNIVRLDAGLAAEFLNEAGQVKTAGTVVSNPALAATLGTIREDGAGQFYTGEFAQKLAAYAPGQDGAVTQADLAAYRAQLHAPQQVQLGAQRIYLPPSSVGAGHFAAAVLAQLAGPDGAPVSGPAPAVTRKAVQATLRQIRGRRASR